MTPDISDQKAPAEDQAVETPSPTANKGKHKDTVRNRKAMQKAATQRFLPIAEIRNDTVVLKNGGLRAVLGVEALNFNLKSETEQKGIIAGYQSFMNTVDFPIQIVMRSTKINIDPYIDSLKVKAKQQKNQLLQEQTIEYAAFIERIVEAADIMQKRFFIVIPIDETPESKSPFTAFFTWMGIDDSGSKALKRHQHFEKRASPLRDRINLVESGLRNIGLNSKRLTTKELIQLYYQVYNPQTSQEQKLSAISDLNTAELTL
ncbi:MAG: TraC family protein [Candidatus Peribacteraceae bacterium]|nr:TraC family protein [Candidatus Peribacteraceae bacterium]